MFSFGTMELARTPELLVSVITTIIARVRIVFAVMAMTILNAISRGALIAGVGVRS